jgi:hypothetical protein
MEECASLKWHVLIQTVTTGLYHTSLAFGTITPPQLSLFLSFPPPTLFTSNNPPAPPISLSLSLFFSLSLSYLKYFFAATVIVEQQL